MNIIKKTQSLLLLFPDLFPFFSWRYDVINVVLGISKNSLNIRSPFEQIVRVDCMRSVEASNVILLHIYSPVQFNRYILPILLPQRYIHIY